MKTNVFNSFRARILAGGATLLAVLVLGLALSLSGGLVRAQDSTIEYPENGTDPVATFTADDPEGATSITWSLATDATIDGVETGDVVDNDDFAISNDGVLTFAVGTGDTPPDFENPVGGTAGDSNTYNVVVLATDAATDGQTGYYKVTVEVTNVDEPGTVTLATNTAGGTPQYLVGAEADGHRGRWRHNERYSDLYGRRSR